MLIAIFIISIIVILFFLIFGVSGWLIIGCKMNLHVRDKYFIEQRSDGRIFRFGHVVIPITLILTIFCFILTLINSELIGIFIACLTISFATMGWIFTNFVSSRNSIRQHTVTILTQMRMSTEFMKNANKLQILIESNKDLDISVEYYNTKEEELKNSIRYILNYLEFVSAGIRLGDLDEGLVKSAQRGMFLQACETCNSFIHTRNSENASTFQHLIATVERWKKTN